MVKAKKEEKKRGGYLARLEDATQVQRQALKKHYGGEYDLYAGDPALHWCIGGLKRGRLNLLWGPSKSGKSTLALKWAAEEQKKTGGIVIIYDSEYAYGSNWREDPAVIGRLEVCGLDTDKVVVVSSNDMNKLFSGIADLESDIADGKLKVAAIICDSWGGIAVESAMGKIEEDEISSAGNSFGGNVKFLNPMILFFLRLGGDYGVTTFVVQHAICNLEPYGKRYVLIGGNKLRHLVHCSIFFESIESADARLGAGDQQIARKDVDEVVAVGKKIRAFCDKSRAVTEGRKVEFFFNFTDAHFARSEESLFDLASKIGVIGHPSVPETDRKGAVVVDAQGKPIVKINQAWWCLAGSPNSQKWHGKPGCVEALKEKVLFDQVFKACMESAVKNAATFEAPPPVDPDEAEKE